MKSKQNPFGLHTITTYLVIEEVDRLIKFLKLVFDAKLRGEIKLRDDQSVMHAEMQIGDSVIMMAEPSPDFENFNLTQVGLYVYVDDCDAVFQKALDHGAVELMKPMDYPHGDRYGGVADFAGNCWWIASHLSKEL